eukprot:TRINITY_DN4751_c0_g1_i3.p1 TRINITY_DN4751_c0_g1~~TRINITY_DN4751_c0_g1_i3.p1  ORF type:complete len:347 (+),score=81.05 TRINITY_DN4751_c0_g1_i3:706-1746(+)
MFGDDDLLRTPQLCGSVPLMPSPSPAMTPFLPITQHSPIPLFALNGADPPQVQHHHQTPNTPVLTTVFSSSLPSTIALLDSQEHINTSVFDGFADFDVVEVEVELIDEEEQHQLFRQAQINHQHHRAAVAAASIARSMIAAPPPQPPPISGVIRSTPCLRDSDSDERPSKRTKRETKSKSSSGKAAQIQTPIKDECVEEDSLFLDGDELELSGSGSSCHQCKSRRGLDALSFCYRMFLRHPDKEKKQLCRKKYCDLCLKKFYNETPPEIRHNVTSGWKCPACRNSCCCAACRRAKAKSFDSYLSTSSVSMSPATSIACGMVFFSDILDLNTPSSASATSELPSCSE